MRSAAFAAALAEERSAARAQYLCATTESERSEALDRLADLDDIASRGLERVMVASS